MVYRCGTTHKDRSLQCIQQNHLIAVSQKIAEPCKTFKNLTANGYYFRKFSSPAYLPVEFVFLVAIAAWRAGDGTSVLWCDLFGRCGRVVEYFKTAGFVDLTCPSHYTTGSGVPTAFRPFGRSKVHIKQKERHTCIVPYCFFHFIKHSLEFHN